MSKDIFMIDRTNNRIVKVVKWIKEDWAEVLDPISKETYLQKRQQLKEAGE